MVSCSGTSRGMSGTSPVLRSMHIKLYPFLIRSSNGVSLGDAGTSVDLSWSKNEVDGGCCFSRSNSESLNKK
ncbi:hypothetical protein PMAYCL1PPCAC_09948 [Pristionchus mayeri]|uniref:Uncharacterized protein n=1 Tax=Pristionchus mayeri TaxID=1317129 RepID=A0AAN5C6Y6_9BILA|nr:hypothetical protein PMAYCL1PPCAC_09948 [Pristionchus mayeri]